MGCFSELDIPTAESKGGLSKPATLEISCLQLLVWGELSENASFRYLLAGQLRDVCRASKIDLGGGFGIFRDLYFG